MLCRSSQVIWSAVCLFSPFDISILHCSNKQTTEEQDVRLRVIYLYILCSLSVCVLSWPLGHWFPVTWGQNNLNTSLSTPTGPAAWLLGSLFLRHSSSQINYTYVHNNISGKLMLCVKYQKENVHSLNHSSRWKDALLCTNKRQWGDSTLTFDTLNRLPAVDGLESFHSLSNTDKHTVSAKHLLFLTPGGYECEPDRGENTRD